MKTSELTGAALDWAVAKCEGWTLVHDRAGDEAKLRFERTDSTGIFRKERWGLAYSTAWAQGGPIIERERLGVCYYHETDGWEVPNWAAWRTDIDDRVQIMGETALIAAMRCFCSAKLGDEIDIPEELCQQQNS